MEREALKLALEAMQINLTLLEKVEPHEDQEDLVSDSFDLTHKAIITVKEALAQPAQEPVNLLEARRIAAEYGTPDSQVDNGNLYFALSKCLEHIDAQPAQEPTGMLHIERLDKWLDASLKEHKQRPWVGLTEKDRNNIEDNFSVVISIHVFDAIEAKLKERNHGA